MPLLIWVNIISTNGLSPNGTKSFLKPLLTALSVRPLKLLSAQWWPFCLGRNITKTAGVLLNILEPSDTYMQQGFGSWMVLVISYSILVPKHYLKQCYLFVFWTNKTNCWEIRIRIKCCSPKTIHSHLIIYTSLCLPHWSPDTMVYISPAIFTK